MAWYAYCITEQQAFHGDSRARRPFPIEEIRGINNGAIQKGLAERQAPDSWVISLVADKATIEAQLAAEQKDIPAEKRLTISKVYTPEELIQ